MRRFFVSQKRPKLLQQLPDLPYIFRRVWSRKELNALIRCWFPALW